MSTKILVPRKGLLVRDPRSKSPLAADGESKPMYGPEGRYWRRRLNCGDVTEKVAEAPKVEKQIINDEIKRRTT